MEGRPFFIEPSLFRAHLSPHRLDSILRIGGTAASSFIRRCEKAARPIRSRVVYGKPTWRAIDLVARARADGAEISPATCRPVVDSIDRLLAERETLIEEIKALAGTRDGASHSTGVRLASFVLTGGNLLTEDEIVASSHRIGGGSGIYFLIAGGRVVYVGQSLNVFGRMMNHRTGKRFSRYAYILCPPERMNELESLYIHLLKPPLNGKTQRGAHCAPMRADRLLALLEERLTPSCRTRAASQAVTAPPSARAADDDTTSTTQPAS